MFAKRKTMLYFVPHQDDELLTMGIDICRSVMKGWEVHVILCTDGSESAVRIRIGNGTSGELFNDDQRWELTEEEFIQARDAEFRDSCKAMGVKHYHIHLPKDRAADCSLTTSHAEKIIWRYLQLYGKYATVCAISPDNGPNQHEDHKTLGRAVNNMIRRNQIQEARLFIEPYHYHEICRSTRLIPVEPTYLTADSKLSEKLKQAIAAYSCWDPKNQRYAVGYQSVTTEFDDLQKNMVGYYFEKWSEQSATMVEKLKYQHKRWLKLQKQEQIYYSRLHCQEPCLGAYQLVRINAGEMDKYKEFCEARGIPCQEKLLQRLVDGSSFWCLLAEDGTIASSGWVAYQQKQFYIGETDFCFDMSQSETAILYHFGTHPDYRGRSLYAQLLRAIVSSKMAKRYIIYTSPDNEASGRGITKAGFLCDGALSAADESLPKYLEAAGFTNIIRKYQMKGLRVLK